MLNSIVLLSHRSDPYKNIPCTWNRSTLRGARRVRRNSAAVMAIDHVQPSYLFFVYFFGVGIRGLGVGESLAYRSSFLVRVGIRGRFGIRESLAVPQSKAVEGPRTL
jgi:hypothetical protein